MMAVTYKQKCGRCKKNYVPISSWKQRFAACFECQKNELEGEIKDPEMKKFFDIPDKCYKENNFLRNIKISYLKFGKLTDKQIEAFRKTLEKMKEKKEVKAA